MLSRRFLPIVRTNKSAIPNVLTKSSENFVLSNTSSNSSLLNENPDKKFTMLTYNMLSPHYMWPQVYTYVPDQYKDWKYRHKLLEFELMQKYKADIMCLQELTWEDYISYWKPKCNEKMNYGSKFVAKTPPAYWEKTKQEMDGEGIFFNQEKFEYISSTKLFLNDVVGTFEEHEIEYMKKKIVTLTDGAGKPTGTNNLFTVATTRNQVCLFVSLRHKATNTVFVVINTHLYWKYDEVKLTQCMIIMRKLSHIINELLIGSNAKIVDNSTISKDVKIIFSGDLNSARDSLVIRFLKGKIINHGNLNMINPMKPYLNRSCYDDIPEGLFDNTCYSGKLKGIFDYVWYHDTDLQIRKILTGVEVSQELARAHQFGLPNANHPSDHIPLLTEFEIL
ncbi:hypothetical protein TPHA_0L00530 [Tetrapisispora phaffii CBS 4417]|uniref:Endonuclease/exonuclease/phosphatase domain-containing protein n=1 Tax=Tetrapisispora phaffii (strain ATCC 24235 / CBS 4417 / NBRC 1672 / NRRL Y-8282 / UCD 70-5) TaxID=1071381 RepID=G8BZT1_TETPH|nr:hypothetical protein TPHA_0L00530 [Tetrapisispora phaffii CBS 4417]CCE65409.1 hypothetical protein TPHA_0L00530 [Tetrapisispora phaffii CBS 4417]